MKLLVTGGRHFADRAMLAAKLNDIHKAHGVTHLIHGAANGADTLAGEWAKANGIQVVECPALWEYYDSSVAGTRRNRLMLDLHPHMVLAFPGGKGTADMVKKAKGMGYLVVMVHD